MGWFVCEDKTLPIEPPAGFHWELERSPVEGYMFQLQMRDSEADVNFYGYMTPYIENERGIRAASKRLVADYRHTQEIQERVRQMRLKFDRRK